MSSSPSPSPSSPSSSSSSAADNAIPPYPEGTPGFENRHGTYWPALNPHARAQLTAVEEWVAQERIDMKELCAHTVDARLVMLRYLRANHFDFRKATSHMTRNLLFRREKRVSELALQRPEEVLGFKLSALAELYPHWHRGFDKTGRPVLYKMYGKFDASRVKKMCGGSLDRVVLYHVWEQEACAALCHAQTLRLNALVETCTVVVDVKDMSLFQVTRDFLAMVQAMAEVDSQQFPETLGRLYIVNTPSAFPLVWKGVKPWIDPVTAAKIHILSSPREFEPALAEFVGADNLPANYGGALPALSSETHPYPHTLADLEAVEIAAACAF